MSNVKNILFALVFVVFLFGPIILLGAETAHIPLPSWFTAADAKELAGGTASANVSGNLNVKGIAEGKLQSALENVVGNRIPLKASAMLGNAKLQRSAIAASNMLFGWDCYPSYFGSNRVHIPSVQAVAFLPDSPSAKESKQYDKRINGFAEGVKAVAARHPEKRFVVYLVQGYATPAYNPAYELMSNPRTARDALEVLEENLAGQDNLLFCTDDYNSAEAYYADFYHSDHHWTYRGANRAYNTIASKLGLPSFVSPGEKGFGDFRFMGSIARAGLDTVEDEVFDTTYDFSFLQVDYPDGESQPYNHDEFENANEQTQHYDFYGLYYNMMPRGTVVRNDKAQGAALLISDSYRGGIQQYLAVQYASTTISVDLHSNKKHSGITEKNRMESIEGFDEADDVFILACAQDMENLMEVCPDYFEERI